MLAGTYMAEYGKYAKLSMVVRFINDILLSAPSIVVGLFVYEIMVAPMGHFSGWAGAAALAIIVIPVVVRTTEDMLALVPKELREAATALGMPRAHVIGHVSYRAARAGLINRARARRPLPDGYTGSSLSRPSPTVRNHRTAVRLGSDSVSAMRRISQLRSLKLAN
jgi:ABC-type methionine transport system permease subunit